MLERMRVSTLIRELEFLKSDYNYKSELMSVLDTDFNKSVDSFLETYPDLGRIYRELIPKDDTIFQTEVQEPGENDLVGRVETAVESVNIDQKTKNLYRQIAKSTHPDKVGDSNLKQIYFEAQKAYESGNTLELMSICDKLKIPYEISEEDLKNIQDEIEFLKNRISFLESTFTFKWSQTPEGRDKDKLILNYIGKKLNI